MRHFPDADPAVNAVRLGDHHSYDAPLNNPPPYMYYDRNITWLGTKDGVPNFAPCVTCHNPHGTNVISPRNDGNNKMVIYRWENKPVLCNRCH